MPAENAPSTTLRAGEHFAGREFCDPAHTDGDLTTLRALRDAFRSQAGRHAASVLRFSDAIGEHVVAVPDWTALVQTRPVALVGFFGQSRDDVDHSRIVVMERNIVARAGDFPGLLAYHNARLGECHWGNMVLFASRASVTSLAPDPVHIRAVASAPIHYESLRLHRGSLADGLLGEADVQLEETLYLDFSGRPAWRALRVYAPEAEQ